MPPFFFAVLFSYSANLRKKNPADRPQKRKIFLKNPHFPPR